MKRAIVAFGGNALIKAGESGIQKEQVENAKEAAQMLVELMSKGVRPILVHGNGPQVGNILIQQEEASNRVPPYTMDFCGAQSQGSMGYLLQRSLENMLKMRGLEQKVVTVLTEVVVDGRDEAFKKPTKPVGPYYEAFRVRQLEMEKGWIMREESGHGYRRLVPSPRPQRIVQIDVIRQLAREHVVIACGGGGIPVMEDASGYLLGLEAVIDKDRTAALLAAQIEAEMFIILTAVEKVALDFGKPTMRQMDRMTVSQARKHLAEGQFPPGSMGPKIEAAIDYIDRGGQEVLITTPGALLRGPMAEVGTHIVPDEPT
jgi:carbamate kinase